MPPPPATTMVLESKMPTSVSPKRGMPSAAGLSLAGRAALAVPPAPRLGRLAGGAAAAHARGLRENEVMQHARALEHLLARISGEALQDQICQILLHPLLHFLPERRKGEFHASAVIRPLAIGD